MDLSSLTSTLPPDLADAERDMGDKFRAAALSITNLYKSSLTYSKQSYQIGYSACLTDMLSMVQSSIGAGQDPSQTLSRLMDWAEARETAMAAFASDDEDGAQAGEKVKAPRSHAARQALLNARLEREKELEISNRAKPVPIPPLTSTPISNDSPYRPDTTMIMSSSPSVASSSIPRPVAARQRAGHAQSPTRASLHRMDNRSDLTASGSSSSSIRPPISTFNPAVIVNNVPYPFTPPESAPGATYPIGSKRPLLDIDMADGEVSIPSTPTMRAPRASKRRSMGVKEDEDRDKEKRRGGRRGHGHGHGLGHGLGHGHGSGGQAV